MSTEKPNGKTQTPEPVKSSGWFGDVFISSNISGQVSPDCNREPREIHEKKSAYSAWSAVKKSVLQLNLRSRRTVKVSLRNEALLAAISYCDLRLITLLTAASS